MVRGTSTASINDGNWHHVAVTTSGSGTTLFIDGVALTGGAVDYTSTTDTTAFFDDVSNPSSITIGAYSSGGIGGEFSGLIDDVRIYDRALTTLDIDQLYTPPDTIEVDTTLDTVDGATGSVAELLGDRGSDGLISFREAILAVNNDDGTNWTIDLNSGTYSFAAGSGDSAGDFDIRNSVSIVGCLLYTSPSPRDLSTSRMPSSA